MTGADRQNGPGGKERLTVMAGEVAAVCISEKKGTAKQNIGSCNFIEDWGLEKDLLLKGLNIIYQKNAAKRGGR